MKPLTFGEKLFWGVLFAIAPLMFIGMCIAEYYHDEDLKKHGCQEYFEAATGHMRGKHQEHVTIYECKDGFKFELR